MYTYLAHIHIIYTCRICGHKWINLRALNHFWQRRCSCVTEALEALKALENFCFSNALTFTYWYALFSMQISVFYHFWGYPLLLLSCKMQLKSIACWWDIACLRIFSEWFIVAKLWLCEIVFDQKLTETSILLPFKFICEKLREFPT